ncbi:TPA: hypothetical protein ACUMYW_001891, partial [Haemophilus influenzae]
MDNLLLQFKKNLYYPLPPKLQAVNPSITAVANNVFENVNFIIRSLWLIKNFVYVIQLKIALI